MFHHWWNHYYCGPKWYLRQIFHDSLHRLQTEELLVNCLLDLSWARSPFLTSCDNFNISTSRIFWLIKSFVDDDITVVGIEIEGSYEVVWEPVPVNVFAEKFLFTCSCIIFVDDLCLKFSIRQFPLQAHFFPFYVALILLQLLKSSLISLIMFCFKFVI